MRVECCGIWATETRRLVNDELGRAFGVLVMHFVQQISTSAKNGLTFDYTTCEIKSYEQVPDNYLSIHKQLNYIVVWII